jgi:hypothetical protein
MTQLKGYRVEPIDSPAGQALLVSHGLTSKTLASAIIEFERQEGIRVGTLIGVSKDGFFGSTREGWRPDQPNAYSEPLLNIPWVQLRELLGRVPEGTSGDFLKSGGTLQ